MVSLKQFVKSIAETYESDEYCNVTGWDFYMESFREWCRFKHIIPSFSWELSPVTVFKGEPIVMVVFDKDDEQLLRELIKDKMFNDNLVMNGSNPFI